MLFLGNSVRLNHTLKIFQSKGIRTSNSWFVSQYSNCGPSVREESKKHKITYRPYVPRCYNDHDHKNMTLKRPMSPHLTIYAPTLPAATSIFQRITGVIVTTYALGLAGVTLFLANGVETYVSVIQSLDLSRPSIFIIKVILGAPFAFHYFNGIRFCAWNAGRWLAMTDVFTSAKRSWIAAIVGVLFFAFL